MSQRSEKDVVDETIAKVIEILECPENELASIQELVQAVHEEFDPTHGFITIHTIKEIQ